MIDRTRRDHLADSIQAMAAGYITNVEFDNALLDGNIPVTASTKHCADPAVGTIANQAWEFFSDDMRTYRLTGRRKLPRKFRTEVLRWALFLRSDREYEWPRPPMWSITEILWFAACFLTLGLLPFFRFSSAYKQWKKTGDHEVWPFRTRASFRAESSRICPLHAAG